MPVYTPFCFRSAYYLPARSLYADSDFLDSIEGTLASQGRKLLFCVSNIIIIIIAQQHMRSKDSGVVIATAEKKILALLLFYTLVFIASLLPYTHRLVTRQQSQKTLQNYFLCEGSRSNQPDLDCNVQEVVVTQLPGLFTASIVMQGLLPAFLLTLFFNSKCFKA